MRSLHASYLDKMNKACLKKNAIEAAGEGVPPASAAAELFKKKALQRLEEATTRVANESNKVIPMSVPQNTSTSKQISDLDIVKNLFKKIQGIKFDDKCPHGLTFYACMSCNH